MNNLNYVSKREYSPAYPKSLDEVSNTVLGLVWRKIITRSSHILQTRQLLAFL